MKKYSYLNIPYGLESNYRVVSVICPRGHDWTIYRCMRADCLENERFVADRKYSNARVKAGTQRAVTDKAWDWETK